MANGDATFAAQGWNICLRNRCARLSQDSFSTINELINYMCTMNDGVWIVITDPYAAPKPQWTSKIQLQGPDAVYCICKLFQEGRLHINNIIYVGYLCSLWLFCKTSSWRKQKVYRNWTISNLF